MQEFDRIFTEQMAELYRYWQKGEAFPGVEEVKELRELEKDQLTGEEEEGSTLFIRPPSILISCIWYRHSSSLSGPYWEWSPYDPRKSYPGVKHPWLKVSKHQSDWWVKEGIYKDQIPAGPNCHLINMLATEEVQMKLEAILAKRKGGAGAQGDKPPNA
eukprot:CAMPEP_0174254728 /NCGR_PEP_ID=MMETSP0439-20130205/4055_1 /TAXON_ID=0 /ORGANISM="Stereomyxa ramosa, Strain Chinc5" /LENGTH=158 /DNA_ID=CAMNT_0015336495 /DNA_START=74 /DNA_END=550 /DNA_ORIENTATION=-